MWSVLVFLAGVIFLMKGSADITKESQARKRQLRREARRNAEHRRREQMQAQLQAQAQYRAQMDAARRSSASAAGRIMWDMAMICKTGRDPDMFLIA